MLRHLLISTLVSGFFFSIEACTGLQVQNKDGSFVNGRTLEFGIKVELDAAVIPRNHEFKGTTPNGEGLRYKSKYGAVGFIAYQNPALLDGLNEKGLSVGTFYFPGFAKYPTITTANQATALSPVEFPNWILTQFATVDEVKNALDSVVIAPTVAAGWGNEPPPFHYVVYDKSGKSLVIEPIDGKLTAYDNPLGILTNSPTFDWHMTNLRNYVNLRAVNAPPLKIDGLEFVPFGQGSGLVGMPGDFTPPSRFVQVSIFKLASLPVANSTEGVSQIFHILNHFDIPVGVARAVENGVIYSDYTLFTGVRDPQTLRYYFKTFGDQTIRMIDLNKFDLNAASVKTLPANFEKQPFLDVSSDLKS